MHWSAYLWVGLGGALGTMARAWVSWTWKADFPWATLTVNLVGALVLGLVLGYDVLPGRGHPLWRDFLTVGFCGGFTTFSTFSWQTLQLLQQQRWVEAGANVGLNVVLTVAACALGLAVGRAWAG